MDELLGGSHQDGVTVLRHGRASRLRRDHNPYVAQEAAPTPSPARGLTGCVTVALIDTRRNGHPA